VVELSIFSGGQDTIPVQASLLPQARDHSSSYAGEVGTSSKFVLNMHDVHQKSHLYFKKLEPLHYLFLTVTIKCRTIRLDDSVDLLVMSQDSALEHGDEAGVA